MIIGRRRLERLKQCNVTLVCVPQAHVLDMTKAQGDADTALPVPPLPLTFPPRPCVAPWPCVAPAPARPRSRRPPTWVLTEPVGMHISVFTPSTPSGVRV